MFCIEICPNTIERAQKSESFGKSETLATPAGLMLFRLHVLDVQAYMCVRTRLRTYVCPYNYCPT